METSVMMFLDCPAYMDAQGAIRCGLPAEIQDRYLTGSTDGPLESAKIRCPRGHWFNGPIEFLTWDKERLHPPRQAAGGHRPRSGSPLAKKLRSA